MSHKAIGNARRPPPKPATPAAHKIPNANGVLGSLADFAAGSAAGTLLRPGWVNMTIDYTVKILAPAKGATVVARGRVVNPGALLTVAAAEVFSVEPDGEILCATALVTMRNVKPATS
jgi:acyl-coenzyme A thioesterase PaaI-like protein